MCGCYTGYRLLSDGHMCEGKFKLSTHNFCHIYSWLYYSMADINECETTACSHGCNNTVGSYYCFCPAGYRLASDNHTCNGESWLMPLASNWLVDYMFGHATWQLIDIDECSEGSDSCAQLCINTVGSYTCSCTAGYILVGQSCVGEGVNSICVLLA